MKADMTQAARPYIRMNGAGNAFIVVQAFDDPTLDRDLIVTQADGLFALSLPKRVQIEPGALEQPQVLADRNQHDQRNYQHNQHQGFGTGKSAHSGKLGIRTGG